MFNTEGICDWCKKNGLLARHDYIDGKHHYSCPHCHDIAKIDVRQFNLDEIALRAKLSHA
ncbi:hypothetical protein HGP28_00455 [Vibrio sp. SM6]|uniref:Uncharacterized protein n=1 Tax=Vibrio agarilyticus TaxID=2726741 RepID=A0A7X8TMM0_9VIBR|nr:hypothetical protein [Vibrio agarilyticus]NLS11355.1 hypothetical protein [Vibrio agarilyticus]